jgi:quercetin dioxygenase-like cupin family protein
MLETKHIRSGEAPIIDVFGQREEFLWDDTATSVFVNHIPAGVGVPMHIHPDMDEACYVLSGSVKFISGETTLHAGVGDYIHVDRGVSHGFVATEDTKLFWICTPGGYRGFFEKLAQVPLGPDGPDFGALAAIGAEYGIEILGPPPTI